MDRMMTDSANKPLSAAEIMPKSLELKCGIQRHHRVDRGEIDRQAQQDQPGRGDRADRHVAAQA